MAFPHNPAFFHLNGLERRLLAPRIAFQKVIRNDEVSKSTNSLSLFCCGPKYSIKAHDSVIGAESQKLKDKILKQIRDDKPNKPNHLHTALNLAIGEITDISLNMRTDDGLTYGASNVINKNSSITTIRQTFWYYMGTV